jgi:hypothetical protein
MTTTDKTGEKLVASIRRTRKGAAGSTGDTSTAKPPAPRHAAARSSPPAKSGTVRRTADGTDRYQSSVRVWPD